MYPPSAVPVSLSPVHVTRASVFLEKTKQKRDTRDWRSALGCWEDALFRRFPAGHSIISQSAAEELIAMVFDACGRLKPSLELVRGFEDPAVGGFADVLSNSILIEKGCLYRFLILHESAHLLIPDDLNHGAAIMYVLSILYHQHIGIPLQAIYKTLDEYRLPTWMFTVEISSVAL